MSWLLLLSEQLQVFYLSVYLLFLFKLYCISLLQCCYQLMFPGRVQLALNPELSALSSGVNQPLLLRFCPGSAPVLTFTIWSSMMSGPTKVSTVPNTTVRKPVTMKPTATRALFTAMALLSVYCPGAECCLRPRTERLDPAEACRTTRTGTTAECVRLGVCVCVWRRVAGSDQWIKAG